MPEETLGNLFLVDIDLQQQSKLMGLYGLGVIIIVDNLEIILIQTEALQSPHLPEELTGNRFLEVQQSKLMELYGFGAVIILGNLE